MRVFTVLLPRADGRWFHPSVLLSGEDYLRVEPAALLTQLEADRVRFKRPGPKVDPRAPHEALLAHAGVVMGVLTRMAEAQPPKAPPKRFLANSDGDRVEFYEIEVGLRGGVAAVAKSMLRAEDFQRTSEHTWDRLDRTRTLVSTAGESLGQLARRGRRWVISANSSKRATAMLARVSAVLGEPLTVRAQTIEAPWKTRDGIVATREEADETLTLANGPGERGGCERIGRSGVHAAGDAPGAR